MKPPNDFAVFILTHGRPQRVRTYTTLRKCGYTGAIWLVVDDEDKTAPEYERLYPGEVVYFSKQAIAAQFDEADNFTDRRAVFYARNASFEIAAQMGLRYFMQMDDDYYEFKYLFAPDLTFKRRMCHRLDALFAAMLEFLIATPTLSIALGQMGELIQGEVSTATRKIWLKRKAMNTFLCSTDRPFSFLGRVNEDVNTYVLLGHQGHLFFTTYLAVINQIDTQQQAGGMTELYQQAGTYVKSFYTVMHAPSCVHIAALSHSSEFRLHHRIRWDHAVPRILSESHRHAG